MNTILELRKIRRNSIEREYLNVYFDNWIKDRSKGKAAGDTIPVYLISGQGGGSRAGAWLLMNMLTIEKKDTEFYRHIFSFSTVSGATSGANMYLAVHHLKEQFKQDSTLYRNLDPYDITSSVYNTNYVNGALYGLLVGSFTKDTDRNATLQKEEMMALQRYFQNENSSEIEKAIEVYFESDYMQQYKYSKTSTPLFFINATVASTGIKAIFSPVKDTVQTDTSNIPELFSAIDLYGGFTKYKNKDKQFNLPLITCVNQSQAFPVANSYNYLDSVGRLSDGGAIDNTGISTSVELYKKLLTYRPELEKKYPVKIKFIFINVFNSKIFHAEVVPFKRGSLTDIFTQVINSIFNASQPVAVRNQSETLNKIDTIFNIQLVQNVALTRLLVIKPL